MEECRFWTDSHTATSKQHCGTHGDRNPTECAWEALKELENANKDRRMLRNVLYRTEVERDRYKAALEKMFVEGAGTPCHCGRCYVCIALEALRSTSER